MFEGGREEREEKEGGREGGEGGKEGGRSMEKSVYRSKKGEHSLPFRLVKHSSHVGADKFICRCKREYGRDLPLANSTHGGSLSTTTTKLIFGHLQHYISAYRCYLLRVREHQAICSTGGAEKNNYVRVPALLDGYIR